RDRERSANCTSVSRRRSTARAAKPFYVAVLPLRRSPGTVTNRAPACDVLAGVPSPARPGAPEDPTSRALDRGLARAAPRPGLFGDADSARGAAAQIGYSGVPSDRR